MTPDPKCPFCKGVGYIPIYDKDGGVSLLACRCTNPDPEDPVPMRERFT